MSVTIFREEEGEMLTKARTMKPDLELPGEQMLLRKQELPDNRFSPVGEEAMAAAARARGDSPARAADADR